MIWLEWEWKEREWSLSVNVEYSFDSNCVIVGECTWCVNERNVREREVYHVVNSVRISVFVDRIE